MRPFEIMIKIDLKKYLLEAGKIDEMFPEAPDIEGKWEKIAQAYLPDGVREYAGYPTVSLGWMMYIGMAVAKYWDKDWEHYSKVPNFYEEMRDKRGFDVLDEYIREDVLLLKGNKFTEMEKLVGECASRTHRLLSRAGFEPGTKEAFHGYVDCLHQMYLMGAAVQLYAMGYKMTKVEG